MAEPRFHDAISWLSFAKVHSSKGARELELDYDILFDEPIFEFAYVQDTELGELAQMKQGEIRREAKARYIWALENGNGTPAQIKFLKKFASKFSEAAALEIKTNSNRSAYREG